MSVDQQSCIAALKVLHNVLYKTPTPEYLAELAQTGLLHAWPRLGDGAVIDRAVETITASLKQDGAQTIERDCYRLLIGPGQVPAYPWGSVYTDRENLVCGATTLAFQRFCGEHGIELELAHHEPWDHIGLVLAILAALLEQGNLEGADELLARHLMPWAPRMLQLLDEHAHTGYYRGFARLTGQLLSALVEQRGVLVEQRTLHF